MCNIPIPESLPFLDKVTVALNRRTGNGLRVLCASLDNDPEKIGKHMLEMLAKFRSEGLFNVVVEDETDDDPGNGE